jgi:hypothetical protein
VAWPSAVGGPDEVAAAPDGRTFALSFGDPAHHATSTQLSDLWLLDAPTGGLTHVPGFPASVALKFTSAGWLPDGRLVILAEDRIAVYRPGATRLRVKRLRLPQRDGGSDGFIPW